MTTIHFDPPLPCGVLRDHGNGDYGPCGRPAITGTADRLYGLSLWTLMPMCQDCTAAMAVVYGILGESTEGTINDA